MVRSTKAVAGFFAVLLIAATSGARTPQGPPRLSGWQVGGSFVSTQRFTYYPDFSASAVYRAEAEITAQAAMTERLALKLGYLWRSSNAPVAGFKTIDNTTTASAVLRWKTSTRAAPSRAVFYGPHWRPCAARQVMHENS